MAFNLEEVTSEVTVLEGELPLSRAQIDKLVQIVIARLQELQRDAGNRREATSIRSQAAPPVHVGE